MDLDSEIRAKIENIQADIDKAAKQAEASEKMSKAMQLANMNLSTPLLHMPSKELEAIIKEMLPKMVFDAPKIIRSFPDGTRRVRRADWSNHLDRATEDYSFDITLSTRCGDGLDEYSTQIWFFKDGSIAFSLFRKRTVPRTCFEDKNIENLDIKPSVIRDKIIEKIARDEMRNQTNKSSKSSSGHCYIATAIYGSYDCPEVWVLRRYRDSILEPTWYGRTFVRVYYSLSPAPIKKFGRNKCFCAFWRDKLDLVVEYLREKGFSDVYYEDK